MDDLKTAAWILRYGARSMAYQLSFIPEERARWRPESGVKSALEVATEAVRAMKLYLPTFEGPDYPDAPPQVPEPATLAEVGRLLLETAAEYAAALEAAGAELDRPQPMPFGGVFRADRAVCFPRHGPVPPPRPALLYPEPAGRSGAALGCRRDRGRVRVEALIADSD
jgi:hypothetical protein